MRDVDVIVVGAGPTGTVLTGLLAQRGLRVAAFDRALDIYPKPRAIGCDHEFMRVLQELGVAGRVLPHTALYRPSEYHGASGQLIKRMDMAPPPWRLGWAPNYVFDQPALDRALRDRVGELECAQLHLGAEVVASGDAGEGVWADVRTDGGAPARWTARYLVACDGGASPIRKQLGIALEDLGFDEPWLVVDAIVTDAKLGELPRTNVQYCEPARPSTFVVGPGNHRRWEIVLLPGDSLSADFPEGELWPLLSRWLAPGEGRLWRAAAYRFHALVAERWRVGRFLLAGDSAHMTPPFMAQGMVQGARDAQNLAWKLERVLRGTSAESLLDTYAVERRPHVTATTRTAIGLGRIICERDPARAAERDARLIAEQGGSVQTTVRQNMIPDLRDGLLALETPGAGTILPQPRVAAAGAALALLDELTGPCIRVVTTGTLAPAPAAALVAALEPLGGRLVHAGVPGADLPARVLQVAEADGVLGSWLESLGRGAAVARPDHYVYGTAIDADAALALVRRLDTGLAGWAANG